MRTNVLVQWLRGWLLVSVLLLVGGCMPPAPPAPMPPQQGSLPLPAAPDRAYQLAYQTFAKQPGWVITGADMQMRSFRGLVNNAATMVVLVEPEGHGSRVTVQGAVLPNKLTRGHFTEVGDYLQLLKEAR